MTNEEAKTESIKRIKIFLNQLKEIIARIETDLDSNNDQEATHAAVVASSISDTLEQHLNSMIETRLQELHKKCDESSH